MLTVKIPSNRSHKRLIIEETNLVGILTSRVHQYHPDVSQEQIVRSALQNPISSPTLAELSAGKQNVVIITSDHTRGLPSKITLPLIIEEIRNGNPSADIKILVATGLHRATTNSEMLEMFGRDIATSIPIVVHDAFISEVIDFGLLPSGSRLSVNRLAVEADLLICEGFIEPHFFAGFSGGRKSILPGICSAETINCNHSARAIAHQKAKTGVLSGNPIHEDMVFAAKAVGVDFILNVALNSQKDIIAAFAGDVDAAHLHGCRFVEQLSTVQRIPADIVITSNGGYPLDQDLYQCAKGVATAAECVNPGGVIIMVASCIDGVGGGDGFLQLMTAGDPETILETITQIKDCDTIPGQWCAQIFAEIFLHAMVILVTDQLEPELIRTMNMTPAVSVEEALQIAYKLKSADASVLVIPDGVSVVVQHA